MSSTHAAASRPKACCRSACLRQPRLKLLIAYSTITETVFAWPGMGKLLIDSVYQLDRPVVVAYVMLVTLIFVIINLVVDILYATLDPRVQLVTPAQ